MNTQKIAIFKQKSIRKVIYKNEWWFSVVDISGALTDSIDPGAYWRKLKQRLVEEKSEVVTFCHGFKLVAPDGKMRETDCANTESIFRIIQSIPSPKAEPFKRWLAKKNPQGFIPNKSTSRRGGRIAGEAREKLENITGRKVVKSTNYLSLNKQKTIK